MMRANTLKRIPFAIIARRFMQIASTGISNELVGKKKKKFSELTPQEVETEVKENVARLRKSFEKDESENYVVPVFKKSILYADQVAVKDSNGEYTYIRMYVSAKRLANQISNLCGSASMRNVAYLCTNNILSPLTQWACWISGQVAMPLDVSNSPNLLKVLLIDARASLFIITPEYESLGKELADQLDIPLLVIDNSFMASANTTLLSVPRVLLSAYDTVIVEGTFSNDFYTKANAMLLYTPGTTGKVKGVMFTHKNLNSQVRSLIRAWKFDANDCLMNALPLAHAQGCINAFLCPLSVGGRIVLHDQFNTYNIWSHLLGINTPVKERVNVFMAVPAIYNLLIAEYEKSLAKKVKMVDYISNFCKENVRLMVSSSAPLPPTIYRRWKEITGHNILECYGTTELGLALSNPYEKVTERNEAKRPPGVVGMPLPDVRVRLVGPNDEVLVDCMGEYKDQQWTTQLIENKELDKAATETDATQVDSANDADVKSTSKNENVNDIKATVKRAIINTASKVIENLMQQLSALQTMLQKIQSQSKPEFNEKVHKKPENENKKQNVKQNEIEEIDQPNNNMKGIFASTVDPRHQEKLISNNNVLDVPTQQEATEMPCNIGVNADRIVPETLVGELQIAGPNVFKSYYDDADSTVSTFKGDFFKTGDIATFQDGVFKVLGRTDVDVIEIAGKKISSYDIESLLLEHPSIRDVTVITVPAESGNIIEDGQETKKQPTESLGVVCVLSHEGQLDLNSLNIFCSKSLPKYLLPKKLKIVDELPRSNMAKVNKQALRELLCDIKPIKSSES